MKKGALVFSLITQSESVEITHFCEAATKDRGPIASDGKDPNDGILSFLGGIVSAYSEAADGCRLLPPSG